MVTPSGISLLSIVGNVYIRIGIDRVREQGKCKEDSEKAKVERIRYFFEVYEYCGELSGE